MQSGAHCRAVACWCAHQPYLCIPVLASDHTYQSTLQHTQQHPPHLTDRHLHPPALLIERQNNLVHARVVPALGMVRSGTGDINQDDTSDAKPPRQAGCCRLPQAAHAAST